MAIGIFDSGIGGLTVLKEMRRLIRDRRMIYLGDTARVPYGIRSPEIVVRYSLENAAFLTSRGIHLLVVACNTSSSVALDPLAKRFDMPIVGVIEPGARAAVKATRRGRVAVLGTPATINSGAYPRAIAKLDAGVKVVGQPCPLFVPLVEEGWLNHEATRLTAREYILAIHHQDPDIDTIVLGCTHYPLLKPLLNKVVENIFDHPVSFIDSALETAITVKQLLDGGNIPAGPPLMENSGVTYCITDFPVRFKQVGSLFLGEPIEAVEVVALPSLEDKS